MSGFLRPTDLDEISSEIEAAKLDEEEQFKRKQEQTKRELREAFLTRDVRPDVVDRVNNAVRIAARQGHHQLEVMTFPCSYCNDGGRRINNLLPDWPTSLEGFAKKAYEFYDKELKPLGFKLTARRFMPEYPFEEAFFLPYARQFLAALDLPLILLGGIDRLATIEQALAEGFAFVAMARALLREPDLPNRMREGRTKSGICIHCNKCMPTIYSGTHCVLVDERTTGP